MMDCPTIDFLALVPRPYSHPTISAFPGSIAYLSTRRKTRKGIGVFK